MAPLSAYLWPNDVDHRGVVVRMALNGRRVLVVEDVGLLALDLVEALQAAGADVLGPAPTVAAALDVLRGESRIDAAVIDVELADGQCFPLATALQALAIPFLFATARPLGAMPAEYAGIPLYQKPYDLDDLIAAVAATLVG